MIVLGIDASTWTATVGIVRDGAILAERSRHAERSHTASLPVLVQEVLADAGLAIRDLGALAVSIGPGSFTGLRIALGIAKGIAFAGGLPLVAVPTLEALALAAEAPVGATVCAALDARKQEIYAAFFRMDAPDVATRLTPDESVRAPALATRLTSETILVGDTAEAYADLLGPCAIVRPFATHHPRGALVALCGFRRFQAGEARHPADVDPTYVRSPDAALPKRP